MRTFFTTPSFCKAALLDDCLQHLYEHGYPLERFRHVIIDNHYPVDKKNNSEAIQKLAEKYGCTYIDCGHDRGLHGGLNFAMHVLGIEASDLIMGCDPDDRPEVGIFKAMQDVMKHDPSLAVLSGMFWVIDERVKQVAFKEEMIAGHKVLIHPFVEMWNVAAFNMRLIKEIGGFKQLHEYYGGLECALYGEWLKRGMRMGYLKDYRTESKPVDREDRKLFDHEYRQWKTDHVNRVFNGSFEEWLKSPLNHSEGRN